VGELARKRAHDAGRHAAAVGAAVQGEVVARVPVAHPARGRQVRRVADDPIDRSEAPEQVGPDRDDRQTLRARDPRECSEGRSVEIGRDHAEPRPCGRQREGAVPGADVREPRPGAARRERPEELGVLADRIDRRGVALGEVHASG